MPALICGSLAFDTITTFPGRFADQILSDQVHILNVSFLVPTLRREFGGCAGNIAYTLHRLGGAPVVMAALGSDGADYLARMQGWGADTSLVRVDPDLHTAQAIIITDRDNNQITAFHPGAMTHAHLIDDPTPALAATLRIGIVAPDGRDAMWKHAHRMHALGIPFVFDPGQQLPQFNGDEHREILGLASWVAVNDYEARMLEERTGESPQALSRRPNLRGVVVTLAAEGCEVWVRGQRQAVPGVQATGVIDPTGCGDAFRGGLLYGLERGWSLERSVALGNRMGALKIAQRGPQHHELDDAVRAELAR
ncbi:MAG: carbohydrate kinase family protein [Burkholderiales bacterium]|nr:carbohydrate kinase family protein [Burkholderiales bacterium]MDE1927896.1 carbohydrate kinase family protein [Burkholderiales bacterium]MDE2159900.1 carbohydrate kinase family protein [Burkholderiales bacterium]MDE2501735.1 carbohydrate kinase family protein [Burkholderiales bacterium]